MSWQLWAGLALLFLAVFSILIILFQYRLNQWQQSLEMQRFMTLIGVGHQYDKALTQEKACNWCRWVSLLVPLQEKERFRLQLLLAQAGFLHTNALYVFLLIKLVALLAGIVLAGIIWMQGRPMFISLVVLAVFVLLPERILAWMVYKRRLRIELALPDFLDMVSIAMRAGLNWMAALQRVVEEFKSIEPALAEVFEQLLLQIQLGMPRERALQQLAQKSGSEDIVQLAQMLIENERLGAPIAPSIEAFTQRLYTRREQKLEEKAAKLSAKMSIVILIFMMIPYFIILLGERFVELSRSF